MEDNLDPGLRPFMLSVSTDINQIFTAIEHTTTVIDKMANTGSIRATESRRMSGVAQEQEFQLLNAKLSEKADNLQLTEESIWQWYAYYQGLTWAGKIEYPDSFAISDTGREIEHLVKAKSAATNPKLFNIIDGRLAEFLGEEEDILFAEEMAAADANLPAETVFEPHIMIDPETGKEYIARTEQEHMDYMAMGYVHYDDK
jgi:hypothetical protein